MDLIVPKPLHPFAHALVLLLLVAAALAFCPALCPSGGWPTGNWVSGTRSWSSLTGR